MKMIISSILSVSSRTVRKILARLMKWENLKCSNCGYDLCIGDLHHINGKVSNDNDNLSFLCPCCHRLAHQGKIKGIISFKEQVGNKWTKYYNKKLK
jgi:hypothetical protein